MPRILSRSPASIPTHRFGSLNINNDSSSSQVSVVSGWEEKVDATISKNDPSSRTTLTTFCSSKYSSITSSESTSLSSSLRRSCTGMRRERSMNFDSFIAQLNEEESTQESYSSIPPSSSFVSTQHSSVHRQEDDGETWGHFVDVASADEDICRHSRLLCPLHNLPE